MARQCCICGDKPQRSSHFLCSTCFYLPLPEYPGVPLGQVRPMPLWLREMKNAQGREEYHEDTVAPRSTSLDGLMATYESRMLYERRLRPIEPVPTPKRVRRQRRQAEGAKILALIQVEQQEAA